MVYDMARPLGAPGDSQSLLDGITGFDLTHRLHFRRQVSHLIVLRKSSGKMKIRYSELFTAVEEISSLFSGFNNFASFLQVEKKKPEGKFLLNPVCHLPDMF